MEKPRAAVMETGDGADGADGAIRVSPLFGGVRKNQQVTRPCARSLRRTNWTETGNTAYSGPDEEWPSIPKLCYSFCSPVRLFYAVVQHSARMYDFGFRHEYSADHPHPSKASLGINAPGRSCTCTGTVPAISHHESSVHRGGRKINLFRSLTRGKETKS